MHPTADTHLVMLRQRLGRRVMRALGVFGKSMVELECENLMFYSRRDEAAFFAWAQAIPAVVGVTDRGRSIILAVKSKRVADASLRELIGLFRRYRIPMRRLAQFRRPDNEGWFARPDAFWFKSVFSGSNA